MTGSHLRTLVAAAGLGFTGVALGGACLDYAGEDWGACLTPFATSSATSSSSGVGSGAGSARLGAGSGEGTGAPAAPSTDCGAASSPDGG